MNDGNLEKKTNEMKRQEKKKEKRKEEESKAKKKRHHVNLRTWSELWKWVPAVATKRRQKVV